MFLDTDISKPKIDNGREILATWLANQPDNFFTSDRNLQRILEFLWGEERYRAHIARLYRFGKTAATVVDQGARASNRPDHLPKLESFDGLGRYVGEVVFGEGYHDTGRAIYDSGVMSVLEEPGNNVLSLSLFYLSAMNGEAGHNCPLACTAGAIKVLQAVGSPKLQNDYLPRLLDSEYDSNFHAAQFLTEIQGGSDVGANTTTASPLDPAAEGSWLLNGEKWFCSNVTADLALVTARIKGQGDGTKGLGLFLVPQKLDNGQRNGLTIRRLKDKLGTRSMATAEVEFKDAVGYQVGETTDGFRHAMNYVINTSRLFNAFACTGNARRAYLTAWTYAQNRRAFQELIIHYPLVQDVLTKMRSDATAMLAGSMRLAKLWDDVETGRDQTRETRYILRLAINLNKYRTAILAHEVINQGIEILGGNGTIEDFSVLPRLLRDNVVYENWEGTHNVIMAQVQRDMRRYNVHTPFLDLIRRMLQPLTSGRLKREGLQTLDTISTQLDALLEMDERSASVPFRPLMERLIDLFYIACMGVESAWEQFKKQDKTKLRLAEFYLDRRLLKRDPIDIENYADQISRLCHDIRPGKLRYDLEDDEL